MRSKAGLSQKQLANIAGVAQSAISYAEANAREPSLELIEKICVVFSMPVSEFFSLAEGEFIAGDSQRQISEKDLFLLRQFHELKEDEQKTVWSMITLLNKNSQKSQTMLSVLENESGNIDSGIG